MRAVVLDAPGRLEVREVPAPEPAEGQVLVEVGACAVCRTDLHVIDGELARPKLPLILGHQAVGSIVAVGSGVADRRPGDVVGVPWLGWADGTCSYCTSGRENLCPNARFTGYDLEGGDAELMVTDTRFCLAVPPAFEPVAAAPFLCAGAIGYRALRLAGDVARLGLYGFGNAARLVTQIARFEGRTVFAFTRPGDAETQRLALELGCAWAGDSTAPPPEPLDAAIVFAPAGPLVISALRATRKGGAVICGGIHMSDMPSFAYADLWGERRIESVANLTRDDGARFMEVAARIALKTRVKTYPLAQANAALDDLRAGRFSGAAVLLP